MSNYCGSMFVYFKRCRLKLWFRTCANILLFAQAHAHRMYRVCAAQIATRPVYIEQYDGHQGKSKRHRLLCYAGKESPSRQLDDFEIVMLISSFIQTRRPVTPASLFCHFRRGQGLIQSPSRQLDDFEIVMLISSFIQTRRPVTPASLFCHFRRGQGLIQSFSACLLQ